MKKFFREKFIKFKFEIAIEWAHRRFVIKISVTKAISALALILLFLISR